METWWVACQKADTLPRATSAPQGAGLIPLGHALLHAGPSHQPGPARRCPWPRPGPCVHRKWRRAGQLTSARQVTAAGLGAAGGGDTHRESSGGGGRGHFAAEPRRGQPGALLTSG